MSKEIISVITCDFFMQKDILILTIKPIYITILIMNIDWAGISIFTCGAIKTTCDLIKHGKYCTKQSLKDWAKKRTKNAVIYFVAGTVLFSQSNILNNERTTKAILPEEVKICARKDEEEQEKE